MQLLLDISKKSKKLKISVVSSIEGENTIEMCKKIEAQKGELFSDKRSIEQNKLMWSIYIELAKDQLEFGTKKEINNFAWELYNDDMEHWAKPLIIFEDFPGHNYRIEKLYEKVKVNGRTMHKYWVLKTSSHWNINEMAVHLNRLYARCAELNIEEALKYFGEWKQFLNDNKVILYECFEMTHDEYKKLFSNCEACLKYLTHEQKELAHISSRGMGGSNEQHRTTSENWLCLCVDCHRQIQHQKGWGVFVEKFPHLKYKIDEALKRG